MQDYSQGGEQKTILEHFAGRTGRFLDVGAADGHTFSNTRALFEVGWSGALVEGDFSLVAAAFEYYREHIPDRIQLIGGYITPNEGGLTQVYYSPGSLLTTTVLAHVAKWNSYTKFTKIWSAAFPSKALLRIVPPPIQFLSVDIEGSSIPVARALLDMYKPELACVECDAPNSPFHNYEMVGFFNPGANCILRRK
jgi:hypothetical protein